jgi:flagellin-like protein
MKKLLWNKRGVSPVVAELLMVAITVAASLLVTSMAYSWVSQQRNYGMQVVNERLVVEDVWFLNNATGPIPNITLSVTNIEEPGVQVSLQVSYILVKVNGTELSFKQSGENTIIYPGRTQSFSVALNWTVGTEYTITMVTERGNHFVSEWRSPLKLEGWSRSHG